MMTITRFYLLRVVKRYHDEVCTDTLAWKGPQNWEVYDSSPQDTIIECGYSSDHTKSVLLLDDQWYHTSYGVIHSNSVNRLERVLHTIRGKVSPDVQLELEKAITILLNEDFDTMKACGNP